MQKQEPTHVSTRDGLHGHILQSLPVEVGQPPRVLIRFDNGQQAMFNHDLLEPQGDGTLLLPLDSSGLDVTAFETQHETTVLPVIEEELNIERRTLTTGVVQLHKVVHEHEELIDEPLLRESVEVERIPINQVLAEGDAAGQLRHEGDTLIIPVLEEVLVVEKRLLLKEELHVTRHRSEERAQQQVTLRRQEVVVNRSEPETLREVGGKDLA